MLTYAKPKGTVPDLGKTVVHKAQGDTAMKAGQYEKAATEYSLAINFSNTDYQPYKSRADSYIDYLKMESAASPDAGPARGQTRFVQKYEKFILQQHL